MLQAAVFSLEKVLKQLFLNIHLDLKTKTSSDAEMKHHSVACTAPDVSLRMQAASGPLAKEVVCSGGFFETSQRLRWSPRHCVFSSVDWIDSRTGVVRVPSAVATGSPHLSK